MVYVRTFFRILEMVAFSNKTPSDTFLLNAQTQGVPPQNTFKLRLQALGYIALYSGLPIFLLTHTNIGHRFLSSGSSEITLCCVTLCCKEPVQMRATNNS